MYMYELTYVATRRTSDFAFGMGPMHVSANQESPK